MFSELRKAYSVFENAGIDNHLFEVLHLFNIASGGALDTVDTSLRNLQNLDLKEIARKRKEGVPMEYIIGTATFAGLRFYCDPKTIVPTAYTKVLVDVIVDFLKQRQKSAGEQTIIEIGTGCGNISISVAMQTEGVKILATDISQEALETARKNVDIYNLNDRITLIPGDMFAPFHGQGYDGTIDLVTCNPPYIPTSSLTKLAPEVVNHQPRVALEAGPYGMNIFMKLINDSLLILKPGGILAFEIGASQEKLVDRIFSRNEGYEDIRYCQDEDGIIRVVSAFKRS